MDKEIIEQDIKKIIISLGKKTVNLSGSTVLISGGAGFLGTYILLTLDRLNKSVLKKPCSVISIDNYITGKKRKVLETIDPKYIHLVNKDITKPIKIKDKIDYIIHAAGVASPIYYQKYPIETIESAIYGSKNLLEIAKEKKIKSFIFFSSSEIYGDPDPKFIPTPETYKGNVSPIGPRSAYDESKRVGETIAMIYFRLYKLPVKIVRPFNIYGPGMMIDDFRVVPAFISSVLKKRTINVHDKGKQTRTFCYISDAIDGILRVLLSQKNGEVYNIGSDEREISILELAKQVNRLVPSKAVIKSIGYPKSYPQDEPLRRCPDLSKAKKLLSYNPEVSLNEGLQRTIDWYKQEYSL